MTSRHGADWRDGGVRRIDLVGSRSSIEPRNGEDFDGAGRSATESAPAKLTLSLRVTGVRPDGLHELDAEMVTVDLADALTFTAGSGLTVIDGVVG